MLHYFQSNVVASGTANIYMHGPPQGHREKAMIRQMVIFVVCMFAAVAAQGANEVPVFEASLLARFDAPDARQGVAVDADHYYATNNFSITKHAKKDGAEMMRWAGRAEGDPLFHLDSLAEYDGRLYASHSNYPIWPMTSSVEVWDAATLEHVATHSFGIDRGSFTWLDRHDGYWWGAFANYDKVQNGQSEPYGHTRRTQVVQLNDQFTVLQSWVLPDGILERISPMSNSGGSWGPDGFLYLTGHDHGETYVMQIPAAGSVLDWMATVKVPLMEGQGIAWDRSSGDRTLWAIQKRGRIVLKVAMPEIQLSTP